VYGGVLKLDQRIVQIPVPRIRQRPMKFQFLFLLSAVCKDYRDGPVKMCICCKCYMGNTRLNEKKIKWEKK